MHHNKAFLSNKHNLVPTTPREASLVTLGEVEKMQEPLRCSGLSLSLELSFLGSLRHFTWYGNRSTQLNAIVGTSVTHTSSFRLIYSPAGPQTQSKWALGCPWPGDLCSQWEWGTAHHPPKPGQQHRVASLRQTNLQRCGTAALEVSSAVYHRDICPIFNNSHD